MPGREDPWDVCVPALSCFSLTQSPSQGRHKDILHYLFLLQLLLPPTGTTVRPGQGPACFPPALHEHGHLQPNMMLAVPSRSSSRSPNHPAFPSAHPGMGQTLCRLGLSGGSQPQHTQVAPTHPTASQITPNCSPTPGWAQRASPGATPCQGTGCRLPPPSPGNRWGCRLYLELRTNTHQRYLK